ncbi:MAG: hypothetical protein R3F19_17765 [Verrucomicrobiales bacterium]
MNEPSKDAPLAVANRCPAPRDPTRSGTATVEQTSASNAIGIPNVGDVNRSGEAANHPSFPETRWSLVLMAGGVGSAASTALNEVCRIYWYPIYAYVRAWGWRPADAEDFTQAFFHQLLSQNSLQRADPERGRFRSFVLKSVSNLLHSAYRSSLRQKRGGGAVHISIDAELGEQRFQCEPVDETSPDQLFDRMCALEVMRVALRQLESEYWRRSKGEIFDVLGRFLSRTPTDDEYGVACRELNTSASTTRSHLHRMRKRYFKLFREEVGHTLENPDDAMIDDEIKHLLDALGRTGLMELSH